MSKFSNRGVEILNSIEDIIEDEIQAGMDELGRRVTTRIAIEFGGQQVYFPFDMNRRNARIYEDFTGDNVHELAEKYRRSTATIYAIIKAEHKRRSMKQKSLLDL